MVNTDGVAGNAARLGVGNQGQAPVADVGNPPLTLSYRGVAQTLYTDFGTASTGAGGTTEDNLMSFQVPLNTLRNTDDSLEWEAQFDVGSTANNTTKQIKIYLGGLGGSVVAQYGLSAPATQDGGKVVMKGRIMRLSNVSQKCYSMILTTDTSEASTTFVSSSTPNQTLSNNLLFLCTGKNGSGGGGIISQQMLVLKYCAA